MAIVSFSDRGLASFPPIYVGIFEGHWDPAVAIVRDGKVLAYAEEERFIRLKHAPRVYPIKELKYCLDQAGVRLTDIAAIGIKIGRASCRERV